MGRLDGKVAIVTGAGTGLGRETAVLYAEEGAKVVVADVREREADETVQRIRSAGGEAFFVRTDVSASGEVEEMIQATEERYGALHIMTANAGILGSGAGKRLEQISQSEIEHIMAVNFWGVCHSLKYSIAPIRQAGGGAMTVTASLAGHFGYPDLPAYTASKHAILGLMKSLAADLLPTIRVNAVSAGSMSTEIGAHFAEAKGLDPAQAGFHRDPQVSVVKEDHFRAHPRQVAYAHLFLVSDEASFVAGQALIVDGGRTAVAA
jgi:NAD(P)-dependent dehydrogenase (short-subunit alcohol dehydrogenase family)